MMANIYFFPLNVPLASIKVLPRIGKSQYGTSPLEAECNYVLQPKTSPL